MTMRCFVSDWCVWFFVKFYYKNTNARDDMTMRWFFSDWCVWFFVKFYYKNTNARDDTTMRWFFSDWCVWFRARNPRFLMPHFGQKTGFRARMNEIKSGIPCSGLVLCKIICKMGLQKYKRTRWHDDALLFSDWCVCIGVNYLQDGFTKIQTHAMTWRCVAFVFGLVRLVLGKILFARWVYKNTNARNDMTMRCFFFRIGAFGSL